LTVIQIVAKHKSSWNIFFVDILYI